MFADADLAKAAASILGDEVYTKLPFAPGMKPMTLLECKGWLKDKIEDAKKDPNLVTPEGNVKTVINFRPDGDLEYRFNP